MCPKPTHDLSRGSLVRTGHPRPRISLGAIAAEMLLEQPGRIGKVFALDPVTPLGMSFDADQIGLFCSMKTSREVTRGHGDGCGFSVSVPKASRQIPYRGFGKSSVRSGPSTDAGSVRRLFRRLVWRPASVRLILAARASC
jgi:hypothetical protein